MFLSERLQIYTAACIVVFLAQIQTTWALPNPLPQNQPSDQRLDILEWAVIGDSWASGVAYNLSNVYERSDREFCYRTKEAWGVQMFHDKSWTWGDQAFHFAACGGSLMADLKRQLIERGGISQVVWSMFGGNNAFFGSIARACIYQPPDAKHLFGWGPAWDEDPAGEGLCKQNIAKANNYMDNPRLMRVDTSVALNDIFAVAQAGGYDIPTFDLYVSGYVHFFNTDTDDCDQWTFAHANLSTGRPKLVKGLRKEINDKVEKYNQVQAEVISNFQIPPPAGPNFKLRHVLPSPAYNGHRFCEAGHMFEDQFYHPDVWLWNLQYYDEKQDKDVPWVTSKGEDGVMFMSAPNDIDIGAPSIPPILATESNPDAAEPGGSPPVAPQQFGFGWTARPFHPKWRGHEALKNLFIQRMRDDNIVGVKPSSEIPTVPPPPPANVEKNECSGLADKHYVGRDIMRDVIETQFCPEAVNQGPISRRYHEGTMDEAVITMNGPTDFRPSIEDCIKYLLGNVIDGCDGNDPNNPENFKGGGKMTVGAVMYEIQPITLRQPAAGGKMGACDSSYKFLFNEYVMWGKGWASADRGNELKGQVDDCALLPDTWDFQYGLGSDGREWTAKFRTGVFQRGCVGQAGKEAGAPLYFGCGGSG